MRKFKSPPIKTLVSVSRKGVISLRILYSAFVRILSPKSADLPFIGRCIHTKSMGAGFDILIQTAPFEAPRPVPTVARAFCAPNFQLFFPFAPIALLPTVTSPVSEDEKRRITIFCVVAPLFSATVLLSMRLSGMVPLANTEPADLGR